MQEPRPEPLEFPRGVRFPTPDEFPARFEAELARIVAARITTGYVQNDEFRSEKFTTYFEINVHASRLWSLFRDLALAMLPEVAAPIVGFKDEEPILGPYTDRDAAIAAFEPHVELLQHDGLIEFGLIFSHRGLTEEVYVKPAKWVQVWTNQPAVVRRTLLDHGLPEMPALEFIDQFPRVRQSLLTPEGNPRWREVIDGLQQAFKDLPPR